MKRFAPGWWKHGAMPSDPARARRACAWFVAAGSLAVACYLTYHAYRPVTMPPTAQRFAPLLRNDFEGYLEASRDLREGRDPYRVKALMELYLAEDYLAGRLDPWRIVAEIRRLKLRGTYLYPPFLAAALEPLAGMEYRAAARVFQFVSLGLFGILWLCLLADRAAQGPGSVCAVPGAVALLAIGGGSYYFATNLAHGNVGLIVAVLLTAGLLLVERRGKWTAAYGGIGGMLIGLAAAIKVVPAVVVLPLWIRGNRAALGGVCAGLVLFALLLCAQTGTGKAAQLFEGWLEVAVGPTNRVTLIRPWQRNMSLTGAFGKLAIPGPEPEQSRVGLPLGGRSGLALPRRVRYLRAFLLLLKAAIGTALCAALIRIAWLRTIPDSEWIRLLYAVLLAALLVVGVSWIHSFALLLAPAWLLLRARARGALRLDAGHGTFLGLYLFSGSVYQFLPKIIQIYASYFSLPTWLALGLVFWSCVRLARLRAV